MKIYLRKGVKGIEQVEYTLDEFQVVDVERHFVNGVDIAGCSFSKEEFNVVLDTNQFVIEPCYCTRFDCECILIWAEDCEYKQLQQLRRNLNVNI